MEFKPKPERKARYVLGAILDNMDAEEKRRRKHNTTTVVKGKKTIFLEEYGKNGYESAKKLVNDGFDTEVYSDIILLGWLGIDVKKEIINAYYQNSNYEDAYKIAEEINERIEYSVLNRELVNAIIEKELKKENRNRDEDDDAR